VDGRTGDLINQRPCQRVPGGPDGLGPLTCGSRLGGGTSVTIQMPNGAIGEFSGTLPLKLPKGARIIPSRPTTYAAARALPTSARKLAAYLNDLPHQGAPEPIWQQLSRLLQFVPVLPPKVAAAVFTLASEQPGITMRPVTDAAGRPGIGISQAGDPFHLLLVFNPSTYRLEGLSVPAAEPIITPLSPAAGAISVAILHTAIVNTEPAG